MRRAAQRIAVLARMIRRTRRAEGAPLCVVEADPVKIADKRAEIEGWLRRTGRHAPLLIILDA